MTKVIFDIVLNILSYQRRCKFRGKHYPEQLTKWDRVVILEFILEFIHKKGKKKKSLIIINDLKMVIQNS